MNNKLNIPLPPRKKTQAEIELERILAERGLVKKPKGKDKSKDKK